jgi:hypothetical protein
MDTLAKWFLYAIGIVVGAFLAAIGWTAGQEFMNQWLERRARRKPDGDEQEPQ